MDGKEKRESEISPRTLGAAHFERPNEKTDWTENDTDREGK